MKLAIACDHAGYALKQTLLSRLATDHDVLDLGTHGPQSVDYPNFAEAVARRVVQGEVARGILICGTGIGMAITANKVPGCRASVVHDTFSARASVEHNHLNVITLGARVIGDELAWEVVKTFLASQFAGGRHQKRLDLITALEQAAQELPGTERR